MMLTNRNIAIFEAAYGLDFKPFLPVGWQVISKFRAIGDTSLASDFVILNGGELPEIQGSIPLLSLEMERRVEYVSDVKLETDTARWYFSGRGEIAKVIRQTTSRTVVKGNC